MRCATILNKFVAAGLVCVFTATGATAGSAEQRFYEAYYLEQEIGGILLLDGVDEVPEAHRYRLRLKEAVEQFARDFPHCRVLVF